MAKIFSNAKFISHTTKNSASGDSLDCFTLNNELGVKILNINDFLVNDNFIDILSFSFKQLQNIFCVKFEHDYEGEVYAYIYNNYCEDITLFTQEIEAIIDAYNTRNNQKCTIETIFKAFQ